MPLSKTLLAIFASVTLASCASMSKEDCQSANLYQKGLEDGRDGKSAEHGQDIQEACSKQEVGTTSDSYIYGRRVGLAEFCNESRATEDAESGRANEVCMQEQFPPYMRAFQVARTERQQEQMEKLNEIQEEQDELREREQKIKNNINQLENSN